MSVWRQHTGMIVLFWLSVGAVAYFGMKTYFAPSVARATAAGGAREVMIERSRDGHYYVAGAVNGTPVTFVIDTGASTVTVSAAVAARAGLAGQPARLDTAGGVVAGHVVRDATVAAGGITVDKLTVTIAPAMAGVDGLLGQNFLRHVEVSMANERMTLRVPH